MRTRFPRKHRVRFSQATPWGILLHTIVALLLLLGTRAAHGQTEGWWTASATDGELRINLRWGNSTTTLRPALSELRGFRHSDLEIETPKSVSYTIEREAGVLALEGSFGGGRGAGSFRFDASERFAPALASLGVTGTDLIGERELFALMIADASSAAMGELVSLGLGPFDATTAIELAMFGVTPEYVREMQAAGAPGSTSATALARLRVAGVTPGYVRELQALGYDDVPLQQLIEMGMLDITPEYIRELRAMGMADLSPPELIRTRMHRERSRPGGAPVRW